MASAIHVPRRCLSRRPISVGFRHALIGALALVGVVELSVRNSSQAFASGLYTGRRSVPAMCKPSSRLGSALALAARGGGPRPPPADLGPFADLDPNEWHKGTVRNIASFGAFVTVTLEDGTAADGLVHISQIRDGFVDNVQDELASGQEVQVRVMSVDADQGKMGLSMKEPYGGGSDGGFSESRESVDLTPFQNMPSDTFMTGKVARCAPFGAFVTVTNEDGVEADGLVHITEIRDGFVENVEDELSVGQEVEVRVKSVDNGKLSLSMKREEF